ncbi:MAG TPA: hypothetical protein VGE74_02815 [Gemmata sp.]
MGGPIETREQAYLALLHHGLVRVRNLAASGQLDLCRIEADYLHNIPSLLHEDNERRHVYFIRGERGLYLQRLRELGATECLEQAGIWYSQAWLMLAETAGMRLRAWDQEAEPGAAPSAAG